MLDKMRCLLVAAVLVCVGAVCINATGQDKPKGIELGKRYVDTLRGFSLRPPAGTERRRDRVAARLVSWSKRDNKSGAIAWTLSVLQATEPQKKIDIKKYAAAMKKQLEQNEAFRNVTTELSPVARKAAIHIRGTATGVQMWQRQVWILVSSGKFLIIKITGPKNTADHLDKICDAVLGTLEITDPRELKKHRTEMLLRGQKVLGNIEDKKLAKIIETEPKWFLMKLKKKDVGFMLVKESITRSKGEHGYEVKQWIMTQLPKDQPRLLRSVMFTTADRSVERWTQSLQIGSGQTAVQIGEDGMKKNDLIVCDLANAGKYSTQQKQGVSDKIYLPKAMAFFLPRLVDLSKKTSYGFATYASQSNSFDMRSLAVIGSDSITINSRRVKAICLTDRPAEDAEASNVWVDKKGRLLRIESSDGLILEPVKRAAVLRRFPHAEAIVTKLGK